MARSGPGAGEPPVAIAAQRGSGSAPRPEAGGRNRKAAWGLVILGIVGHVLRRRHVYEGAAVAVIVLGSLKRIGQESGSSALTRLAAWNKREIQRLERKAASHVREIKGAERA
jgi:hypothetical protein